MSDTIRALSTEIFLTFLGFFLIILQAFLPKIKNLFVPLILISLIFSFYLTIEKPNGTFFYDIYYINSFSLFFQLGIIFALFITILIAQILLKKDNKERGEIYSFILWSAVGMFWMASTDNLILIFVGFELLSLNLYILTAFYKETQIAQEAALKYFLLSSFASAISLFGMAFYYGATDSLELTSRTPTLLLMFSVSLMACGFLFKLSLFPFHSWAPDVYQGSPSYITLYLSTVPKFATISVLIKIAYTFLPNLFYLYQHNAIKVLGIISIISMFLGNLIALVQKDLKRMLAFSGIAHMGYLFAGILGKTEMSISSVLFYGFTYIIMTMGGFAVLGIIGANENEPRHLNDYKGLGFVHPFPALVLTFSMASLAGIPPFQGFSAKFFLFYSLIDAKLYLLALIGILNSILSIYYYVRVIYILYMKEKNDEPIPSHLNFYSVLGLSIILISLIYFGAFPNYLFERAAKAAEVFLGFF